MSNTANTTIDAFINEASEATRARVAHMEEGHQDTEQMIELRQFKERFKACIKFLGDYGKGIDIIYYSADYLRDIPESLEIEIGTYRYNLEIHNSDGKKFVNPKDIEKLLVTSYIRLTKDADSYLQSLNELNHSLNETNRLQIRVRNELNGKIESKRVNLARVEANRVKVWNLAKTLGLQGIVRESFNLNLLDSYIQEFGIEQNQEA